MSRAAALALVAVLGCGMRPGGGTLQPAIRTELFFGRARASGAVVDDAAWAAFLAEVVTPRFPDGFTVLDGAGQYRERDDAKTTRERTEVLIVVHDDDARAERALGEIVDAYKTRFGQRAVLRVDTTAAIRF